MKLITQGLMAGALLVIGVNTASAGVLTFDDAYAASADPATYYSSVGVTISGNYFGVVGGVGNGDPGGWRLNGTNGPAFLGCNEGNSCSPTFQFSSAGLVSLDIGLSYSTAGSFTVSGYRNSSLVDSSTLSISDPDSADGTWRTFTLVGSVDKIVISSSGKVDAYGIDNVRFASGAPEPASLSMLLFGAGTLGFATLRLRKKN